jgi:hypothetical protein
VRTIAKLTLLCLTLGTLACREKDDQVRADALSDDLRRDLELAQSEGLELASSAQNRQRTHVVSAIELFPATVPLHSAMKRSVGPRPAPAPQRTAAAESRPAPQAASEPRVVAVATREPEIAPQPSAEPLPAPEPVPIPVSHPSDEEMGVGDAGTPEADGESEADVEGDGSVIGDIIGVVIRGGHVGDDHCEIHERGGGRGPGGGIPYPGTVGMPGGILINDRIPVSQPTFPRW